MTDETVYTVKVTVKDNGDGTLRVTRVIEKAGEKVDSMVFDNKLFAPLTIHKRVEGYTTSETFPITVWIYDAQGEEIKTPFAYTGDVTGTLISGEAIELGHDQTVIIQGLTPGMRYKLTEKDPRFATTINTLPVNTTEGTVTEGGNTAAFVNTLIATEFKIRKEWRGAEGGQITLTLYANGVKLDPQPMYEQSGNTYKYTGLPKFDADGDEIIYSAKEKYMYGYLTIYSNVAPYKTQSDAIFNGGTIINKAVMDFKVQKVWSGLDDNAETPEISLILYCNGVVYDDETPEPDKNGWYHYRNLPLFVNGERAEYTVVEETMDGFITTYTNDGEDAEYACNGGVITNTAIPKTGDHTPVALWTAAMLLSAAALMMLRRRRA